MSLPADYADFVKLRLSKSFWQSRYETEAVYVIRNFFQDIDSAPDYFAILDIPEDGDISQTIVRLIKDDGKLHFAIDFLSANLKYGKKRFADTFKGINSNELFIDTDGVLSINPAYSLPQGVTVESINENLAHVFEQVRCNKEKPYPVFLRGSRTRELGVRYALQGMFSNLHYMPDADLKPAEHLAKDYCKMPLSTLSLPLVGCAEVDEPRPTNEAFPKHFIALPLDPATLDSTFYKKIKWSDLLWNDATADFFMADTPMKCLCLSADVDGFQNIYLTVSDLNGFDRVRLIILNVLSVPLESFRVEINRPSAPSAPAAPVPTVAPVAASVPTPTPTPAPAPASATLPYNAFVLDTNAILTTPRLIPTFLAKHQSFIVPLMVFHELNKRRINNNLTQPERDQANRALAVITQADPEFCKVIYSNKVDRENLPMELQTMGISNDMLILSIALRYARRGKNVALITADRGLITTCNTTLTGRKRVTVVSPADALAMVAALPNN